MTQQSVCPLVIFSKYFGMEGGFFLPSFDLFIMTRAEIKLEAAHSTHVEYEHEMLRTIFAIAAASRINNEGVVFYTAHLLGSLHTTSNNIAFAQMCPKL